MLLFSYAPMLLFFYFPFSFFFFPLFFPIFLFPYSPFYLGMTWLTTLLLFDNPCCTKDLYRLRALYRLPNLLNLDNVPANNEEKVRAFNLYHSPLGDLALRESVLNKHLPKLNFVDYAPEQLIHDQELDLSPLVSMRIGFVSVYMQYNCVYYCDTRCGARSQSPGRCHMSYVICHMSCV
jgi:hypothetical protein